MSTHLYLECRSHDPAIISPAESGQHTADLPAIRAWLNTDRDDLPDPLTLWNPITGGDDPFGAATVAFLREHPACNVGVRDEYGRPWPVAGETASIQ